MADKKISELPSGTTVYDADDFAIVQDGTTKQFNASAVKTYVNTGVVTLTGTQTLTNKTLTSPTINGGTGAFTTLSSGSLLLRQSSNAANTSVSFDTTVQNALTLDSSGVLSLGQGQLKFPATQVASSNANTLDDYEEGTFTPVLTGSTSGTFNGAGAYTKIGNTVYIAVTFANITTSNKPIGNYTITGLPFTSKSTNPDAYPLTVGSIARVTFNANKILGASISASSTTIILYEYTSNDLSANVTDANFVNAATMFFRVTGFYFTE